MIMKMIFSRERARLELLMELGRRYPAVVQLAEAARTRDLPEPLARRLAAELAREGVVESRRGRGGGVRLARAPHLVRLGAVLEPAAVAGGSPALVRLERELARARAAVLERTTLADLLAWEAAAAPLEYVI